MTSKKTSKETTAARRPAAAAAKAAARVKVAAAPKAKAPVKPAATARGKVEAARPEAKKPAAKAPVAKVVEAKVAPAKSVEAKPVEAKAVEAKAVEAKTVESRTVSVKPDAVKPAKAAAATAGEAKSPAAARASDTAARLIALSRANRPAEKPAAPAPAAPAPAAVAAPAPAPAPVAAAPAPAPRPAGPVAMAPKPAPKPPAQKLGFKLNEHIVYPAHGVGQIVQIEEKEVAGFKLELFVINFVKDKMILRVPTAKASTFGMRKLADAAIVKRALDTLTGRARIKRTMWSRRAQEYEAKINSGDLVSIAEVVRDLYRSEAQPEQSYSERQLYEAALDRIAREIAAVQKLTETEALKVIEGQLQKGPKRGAKAEAETEATAEGEAESETGEIETGVDEAA